VSAKKALIYLFLPPWLIVACFMAGAAASAETVSSREENASRYFESIRHMPTLLLAFLQEMPKGGDLHNHLPGAIYAESFIDYAASDGYCVDRTTSILIAPPCDRSCEKFTSKPPISCAYEDPVLYNSLVDAWSMRNWSREESGHDHFFATFDKFMPALVNHFGDALAEAASRAASDHLQYLELMHTADGMQAAELGGKLGWDDDFGKQRDKLLGGGLKDVIATTRQQLDRDEAGMHSVLKCGTPQPSPGCDVTVRFLYQVLRGLPREQVFAQILLGFELAQADARFVGLNLVMPEDWYIPMRDFELHMHMLDYLHSIYPKVHISLHAGELAMGLVPPEGLRSHIRDSVERGHAERIGHGVAVMYERDPLGLMREMSQRNVLVEICLTSNDVILGVRDSDHPLPIYLRQGVPVALATDDEGVSRANLTREYVRAAESYDFSYGALKRMARQSLEHSFLSGPSLWEETQEFRRVPACTGDTPGSDKISKPCRSFLNASERARMQWTLEAEFVRFEPRF
jgi:adenosine deaminase